MLVHAAAVITPKGALLVLGHTGAGKSTFCRLVADYYPTLADDICSLSFYQDSGWVVTDAQSFCKDRWWVVTDAQMSERDKLTSVPLHAIVRVFQSRSSRLVGIPNREACRHLMDAVFEVESQRNASAERKRQWFTQAALVSRKYGGWQLMFSLDSQVVGLIQKEFGSTAILPSLLPKRF
jgi:energy-coupling factor transporter ATP-binding protein EcfA2